MYDIFNKTKIKIKVEEIDKYIMYLVKKLKLDNCLFNVIFVDMEEIRKINKEYRHIDKETDVISFALENYEDIKYKDFRLLGDIYICLEVSEIQAKEYNHSLTDEIYFFITHGVLHLLGYDHLTDEEEKVMFDKQNNLIEEYK